MRERDFRLVAAAVVDLSAGGALVGPAERVLTGERVIVTFPDLRGGWIDAEAVVARVVHGRRAGERTRQLGLAFEALDESSTRALERLLASRVVPTSGSPRDRRADAR